VARAAQSGTVSPGSVDTGIIFAFAIMSLKLASVTVLGSALAMGGMCGFPKRLLTQFCPGLCIVSC
jgi:hypothetical protein